MTKEENLIKAKELGMEGVESLSAADLDKAVKAKIKRNKLDAEAEGLGLKDTKELSNEELEKAITNEKLRNDLVAKATKLGIDAAADFNSSELESLIMATENTVLSAQLNVFSTTLGIDNASDLSLEDLETAIKAKLDLLTPAAAKVLEVTAEAEPEGKTDKAFKAASGKKYVFTADAPAAFRFAGAMKTQEDWIADTDSMQLMVDGELEYLTLKTE